jgi:hypothetical protein
MGPITRNLNKLGVAKQYKLSGSAQIEQIISSFGFKERLAKIASVTGTKYMTVNEVRTSGSTLEWV